MRQTQRLRLTPAGRLVRSLPGIALSLSILSLLPFYFAKPLRADDAAAARRAAADSQFARAEALRADIEAKPERERTLQQYTQLVAAYRHVYLITPRAPEVPGSIKQVADLYRHMGEQFDPKYFQSAIETYQFLAHDYPTSDLRPDALLAIAEIERTNLSQNDRAQEAYENFLKQYPRSPHAPDARKALAGIKLPGDLPARDAALPPAENSAAISASKTSSPAVASNDSSGPNKPAEISHVRVWNADNYTRIVIDLGSQAKYQAARIANPDRIYFDIDDARLSPQLARESIDVPESGYLQAVRVAQNKANTVRIVLDVTKAKDYSVFELANPDRLIVDVYGPGADIAKGPDAPAKETKTAKLPAPNSQPSGPASNASSAVASAPSTKTTRASAKSTSATVAATDPSSLPALDAALPEPVPANARDPFVTPKGVATKGKSSHASVAAAQPKLEPPASPVDSVPLESAKAAAHSIGPPSIPEPTRNGEHSLTRALGLKIGRIVIDAGHGGRDTGTIGPAGLMEKDLCLDVALRLGKLIQQRLPATEVTYTRDDDTFVPLEQRTAIANQAKADLFISIHANSSDDRKTSGIETYYLNFSPSPQAMEVATRENATAQSSVHDLEELVAKIARNEKIEESRDLAADIQDSLAKNMQKISHSERDRGVRKAPFVVLIGADMPSVLSEISFLSNPTDEQWLKKPDNRERVAEGLYHGIESYLQSTNSLSSNLTSRAAPLAPRP